MSEEYDDVYFSAENGLGESDHVFIHGNNLTNRFCMLTKQDTFTLFECGFGTGLNLQRCLWHWHESNPKGRLRYIAIEASPLSNEHFRKAYELWHQPDLYEYKSLFAKYTKLKPGYNHLQLSQNISLELVIADINELASNMPPDVSLDAVFMDGFSPSKNPAMWTIELCEQLFKYAKIGATLSTYTVAGMVKRNLSQAGFVINKAPGFGRKRNMLTAYKADN